MIGWRSTGWRGIVLLVLALVLALAVSPSFGQPDDPLAGGDPPAAGSATGDGGAAPPMAGGPVRSETFGPALDAVREMGAMSLVWLIGAIGLSYLLGWLVLRILVPHEAPGNAGCFGCFTTAGIGLLFVTLVFFGLILPATLPEWVVWTIVAILVFGLIVMAFRLTGSRRILALLLGLILIGGLSYLWMVRGGSGSGSAVARTGSDGQTLAAQRAVMQVTASESKGTAFFVSRDGKALTNRHVVGTDRMVRVELFDKRVAQAEVVRVDQQNDLAVLQVQMTNAPYLELGDSDRIKTLAPVIAIGFPLGVSSVTDGKVSNPKGPDGLIVMNANVNPGNSGGPLIDTESGKVIGIVAAAVRDTPMGTMEGINLAIPINLAKRLLQ